MIDACSASLSLLSWHNPFTLLVKLHKKNRPFCVIFESGNPIFVVLGTEGVDAEGLGGGTVFGAVVDEEGFVGCGLLTVEHHLENLGRRFHDLTLITEIEVVEIVVDGVMATIERWRAGPLHHVGVGVRQQTDLIALLAQLKQHVEVALWDGLHIAVPRIEALVGSQLAANDAAQFLTENFCRDLTTLEVTKDAVLMEGIEVLTGVTESDFLERLDGVLVTQGEHYATKVEGDIFNRRRH